MGDKCHDYIIADKFVLPKEEAPNYTEKILYLPNCYQANRSKIPVSDSPLSKKDFGLPEGVFVFGCFNNSYKINPGIFDTWMKILKKHKNSVLWLLNTDDCSKNLINEALKQNIDSKRIIFCERTSVEIYHSRFKFIDLFLDTYPYNAHTTASIAVRMGIPIITIAGKSFASRVAGSILSTVGLKELITKNSKEYIQLALKIATDREKLKKLKSHLSKSFNTTKLFNSKKFTRDLENIFTKLINEKTK
jgi:predicted O-linked N-acetylglucosamine transferase (SPINDLY family)